MERLIKADKLWFNRPQIPKGKEGEWVEGFMYCLTGFSEQIRKQIDNDNIGEIVLKEEFAEEIIHIIDQRIDASIEHSRGITIPSWIGVYQGEKRAYQDVKEIIKQAYTQSKVKYFTPQEVRKMTPQEVRENYDLIVSSMKFW